MVHMYIYMSVRVSLLKLQWAMLRCYVHSLGRMHLALVNPITNIMLFQFDVLLNKLEK